MIEDSIRRKEELESLLEANPSLPATKVIKTVAVAVIASGFSRNCRQLSTGARLQTPCRNKLSTSLTSDQPMK
jgi:hypothetical protein